MGLIDVIRARSVADTMRGTHISRALYPYKYSGLVRQLVRSYTARREARESSVKLY